MGAEQSQLQQLASSSDFQRDYISFFVNGREYNVKTDGSDPDITPQYLLVDYLRDKIGLTGTKYMCREGGCGACMVAVKSSNIASGNPQLRSVNSCLLPLFACDGLEITTVERLGNRKKGYHPIQERLVKFGGTQCGFCTPGFVMHMYSLAQNNPRFTGGEVEGSFDGNICRCTGYRPIIDAFKSLSPSAPEELLRKCQDIEDCFKCPMKSLTTEECFEDSSMEIVQVPRNLYLHGRGGVGGQQWFKVTSIPTLFEILQEIAHSRIRYRLVAGNTGTGIFKNDGPYQAFIEVNDIPELHNVSMNDSEMVLGGGVTLSTAIDEFHKAMRMDGFAYAAACYRGFRRVACLSVRNLGTLAGNLMLKHDHRDFISDVFTLFESVGAILKIGSSPTLHKEYTLTEFLDLDMNGKVILSIHLPVFKGNCVYRMFKIGKRYQHSIAHVNAAFLFNIDNKNGYTVVDRPSICYGGINPNFIHARATEDYLSGKRLNVSTLQGALSILSKEAVPIVIPENGSPEYILGLAQSFLYKFILGILGNSVNPRLKSGAGEVERGLNTGTQTYDTDKSKWPLYQPIPKLESYPQASGEAEFVNDRRAELDELFGVFILTTVANATLKNVDASEALMLPDVVTFITAKDIPGANNHAVLLRNQEEIFVSSRVRYAGQAVGLLVARSKNAAFDARSRVKVTYANVKKPVLDIRNKRVNEAEEYSNSTDEDGILAIPCKGFDVETSRRILSNQRKARTLTSEDDTLTSKGKPHIQENLITVEGEVNLDGQYHFHMETQICICVPKENGMDVYSSTQHMQGVQAAISSALNVPMNTVNVQVRRLGGGFGAKISKAAHIATACAVAAHVLNKPVRVALDLETNMHLIGKRLPYHATYKAEVDQTGKIFQLKSDITCDAGGVTNEPTSLFAMICAQSCYRAIGWSLKPGMANTDTAPNTYCRAPGSAQGVAIIETIMEHIAFTLKRDPMEVRQVNFIRKGDPFIGIPGAKLPFENLIPKMIKEMNDTAEFWNRKKVVEMFNENNRWKKRGISMVPQRFPGYYNKIRFPTLISVYAFDGTVNVSHGGIEIGQGLNTKVAQVVAATLGIPLEKVKIQPSNTVVSPNTDITGGSIGSELTCSAALGACQLLLAKLAPLRKELNNPSWEELVAAANAREILLTAQYQNMHDDLDGYDIWGLAVTEVEIDVLTGDYKLIRTDIIEDAGDSLSPLVDIGQIEGAFIMGLGWYLTEELIYDQTTGELLTNNSFTYKPMLPADIPEDFRVTLLRNAPNPVGVLSSKATGEPPLNLSVTAVFALRNAIDSARRDAGNGSWYRMDGTITREAIRKLALTSPDQFLL